MVGYSRCIQQIERVVKKEIRQNGTYNSPLRGPALSVNQGPIRHAHGRPKPPFKVEQNPLAFRMPTHRSHQEVPIDFIEEALDVEVEHPVVRPTTAVGPRPVRRAPISLDDIHRNPGETPVPGSAPGIA